MRIRRFRIRIASSIVIVPVPLSVAPAGIPRVEVRREDHVLVRLLAAGDRRDVLNTGDSRGASFGSAVACTRGCCPLSARRASSE